MNTLTFDAAADFSSSPAATPVPIGATFGGVSTMLRLEAAVVLTAAVLAYRETGGSWWLFTGLFFVPDLSMLGYLANRKLGAALYNGGHTYLAPAALALLGWSQGLPQLFGPALIWAAHIGFDRLMGYGLKYGSAFGATHLGWRGKREGAVCGR
ncbi:DUF4260 domain-containing protein [Alsobacter sp. SYSU M60028]|uniref:DUF4260 domain-containing protein n=1 Tax=Alsobacter ponti TaxID=2962936 RepID=A0ABT1LHQ3_9HYPH|nr:DUF4260 domain-containing protein [Alsobacter ponti]MCP8941041.1 DUF4260 domain-containing protein [Alsobacter ponti]